MNVYFLAAQMPLTKSYKLSEQSEIQKTPYPHAALFTSYEEPCATLVELFKAIKKHALLGRCMLKGVLHEPLVNESRAGSTTADEQTTLLCLDFDKAEFKNVEDALEQIHAPNQESPFKDVSYILQYSASHGLPGTKGLNCHVFIQVSHPVHAPFLKAWLMRLNLQCEALNKSIKLNATNTGLLWPLDITTCQNDKLLFIAPPQLGKGVTSTFREADRYQLVPKALKTLPIERIGRADLNTMRDEAQRKKNTLRVAAGMEAKPHRQKLEGEYYTTLSPGEAVVTGIREDAKFTHMNLNSGDSWSYWHPADNHEYIYCFKHPEERFRTKELLPSYYKKKETQFQAEREALIASPTQEGNVLLAFRDFKSSSYWNGTWNPNTYELRIAQTKDITQLNHFMMSHGREELPFIPVWDKSFLPQSNVVYDPENNTLNTYIMSPFMRAKHKAPQSNKFSGFPLIDRIMRHVVSNGKNDELYEHWLNWLGAIYQYRIKTLTAWAFTGVEGTGKNLIVADILAPTIGEAYVQIRRGGELEEHYNGFLEESLVCFFDEVQIPASDSQTLIAANLRNYITEHTVTIRNMHRQAFTARNYTNLILASNRKELVHISEGDRRYNIGMYQDNKLAFTDADKLQIKIELPAWMDYIMTRKVDLNAAKTTIKNEARQQLIEVSRTSHEDVAMTVSKGNLAKLIDFAPANMDAIIESHDMCIATHYNELIKRECKHLVEKGTPIGGQFTTVSSKLTREELHTIFEYAVGNMPSSPAKLTIVLKHKGINMTKVWVDEKAVMGTHVSWVVTNELFEELKAQYKPAARIVHSSTTKKPSNVPKAKLELKRGTP